MSQEIQAIRFDVEDIGKHLKSSKKRYTWVFILNGRNHTLQLDFSFISYKVKLVVDRKIMLQNQLPDNTSFQHPFALDGFSINILQQGDSFQLRINNKVFSHLYNQAKTNIEFKNYQDQVKDIRVTQGQYQNTNKIVKINIGALDGVKKKNKNSVESQHWGDFESSGLGGIPSYFGDGSMTTNKYNKKQQQNKIPLLQSPSSSTSTQSDIPQTTYQPKQPQQKPKTEQVDFFANQPPQQPQPTVSTSPSQQLLEQLAQEKNIGQDFNTMQKMFATVTVQSGQSITQQNQIPQSGLDLLNSATVATTTTGNPVSTYDDFNTMQNLFATQNQPINLGAPPLTNIGGGGLGMNIGTGTKTNSTDFQAMQNAFSTVSYVSPSGLYNPNFQTQTPLSFPNPKQFATMQNISQMNSPPMQPITLLSSQPSNPNPNPTLPLQQNQPTAYQSSGTDFNTMQNLFSTSQNQNPSPTLIGIPIQNINTKTNQQGYQTDGGFNTMQNLFSTGNAGKINPSVQYQSNQQIIQNIGGIGTQSIENKSIDITNLQPSSQQLPFNLSFPTQNTNPQQFNTMQNLFKTQTGVTFIPPPQPPQNSSPPTSAFHKKQNPLDLLGSNYPQNTTTAPISQPTMFNTYSGPKSSISSQIVPPSQFGTIQANTIDFFQVQSPINQPQTFNQQQQQQQQSQIPNFSKKKQPLDQDLI